MKNRLSSRLRLTLSGVTLLTLLLMCALVFAGMYFQTTADNREQLRQQAAWVACIKENRERTSLTILSHTESRNMGSPVFRLFCGKTTAGRGNLLPAVVCNISELL